MSWGIQDLSVGAHCKWLKILRQNSSFKKSPLWQDSENLLRSVPSSSLPSDVSHYSRISPSSSFADICELGSQKRKKKRLSKWGALWPTQLHSVAIHFHFIMGNNTVMVIRSMGKTTKKCSSLKKLFPRLFFTIKLFISSIWWHTLMKIYLISVLEFKNMAPAFLTFFSSRTGVEYVSPPLDSVCCDELFYNGISHYPGFFLRQMTLLKFVTNISIGTELSLLDYPSNLSINKWRHFFL